MNKPISILEANSIELHYWFNDDTHFMDAMVFNKCEREVLMVIKELSDKLKLDVVVVIEPISNGGIRSWLAIKSDDSETLKVVKGAILTTIFSSILLAPVTIPVSKVIEKAMNSFFEDPAIIELEKLKNEKKKLEYELDILKLKEELKERSKKIDEYSINKKRSNFYNQLEGYPKVTDLSISLVNSKKEYITETKISRSHFGKYILLTDELEPEVNENAIIEIISPVLKKGNYKWVGIYDNQVIHFNMKSPEFKKTVLSGQINFKSGSRIDCELVTNRKLDSEGRVIITGYDVAFVKAYAVSESSIETKEAKMRRKRKEADRAQTSLFDEDNAFA